jgi:Rad3-related DNA helicase
LIDRRFLEPRYESLFPSWWRVIRDEMPDDWGY